MIHVHDLRLVSPDQAEAWLEHIAAHLREQDCDEVRASSALDPREALFTSVGLSSHGYVIVGRDGDPVAAFGAAPHPLPGVGVAWLLGTDGIRREALSIARETPRYVEELQRHYLLLWNYVDARNSVSMRWLQWGGFKLLEEHRLGPESHRFFTFARSAA